MGEKSNFALVLIQQLALLAFAICLLTFSVLIFKANSIDTSSLKQIADDWKKQPYIDLYVAKGNSNCPPDYGHVFSRWWPGTIDGCDCRYSAHYSFSIYSGYCDYNQTYYGCTDISSIPPVYIAMLGNYSICGKTGGDSFLDSQRVNSTTGLCPANYTLCNPNSKTNDYKICRKNKSECPINYFQMTTTNDSSPSYKYLSISTNLYLKYGYLDDSLPITSFLLEEGSPCMIPSIHSQNPNKVYYILENEMSSGCQYDEMSERYTDPRYTVINQYSTNEYDLFQNNYILDKLMTLPNYNGYQNYKKNYYYYLYERPTINWKLSCELNEDNPVTRHEAYAIFRQEFVSLLNSILLVVEGSIFAFIVKVTLTLSIIFTCFDYKVGLLVVLIIQEVSLVLITIFSFILFINTRDEAQTSYNLTMNAQKVNGCSDEYANFNIEKLANNFQNAHKYSEMGLGLAIATATYIGIQILIPILILIAAVCIKCCEYRNTKRQQNIEKTLTTQSENLQQKIPLDEIDKIILEERSKKFDPEQQHLDYEKTKNFV